VPDLAAVPDDFRGIAVTADGRLWDGAVGELVQAARGGAERVLAERNRRDRLIAESERAVAAEHAALQAVEAASGDVAAADAVREVADRAARDADRARAVAREEVRQAELTMAQRRGAPEDAAGAVRRAQVRGELTAERRNAERRARERAEREQREAFLAGKLLRERGLVPWAERLAAALDGALAVLADRVAGATPSSPPTGRRGGRRRRAARLRPRGGRGPGRAARAQRGADRRAGPRPAGPRPGRGGAPGPRGPRPAPGARARARHRGARP
jgi:chromosome segregation protein